MKPTNPSTVRSPDSRPRLLITAGPTQEPIDSVRYIGNRSSGRLGVALADRAAARGWSVVLLLGPTARTPSDSRVTLRKFRTTQDLGNLMDETFASCDALVMAAAVADYRPARPASAGKLRRENGPITLQLEPTPDLLARAAAGKRPDQVVVGFALELRAELMDSARSKLRRKGADLLVANPLETMDADDIEAWILDPSGERARTSGAITKSAFADLLLDTIAGEWAARAAHVERPAGAAR